MTKAIFVLNRGSIYDDLPESHYHFPKQYLRRVEATIGDWIIYYEPRRNQGRMVYFSTARVTKVQADPEQPDHFYAFVSDYLEFKHPVPFKEGDLYYESSLKNDDGGTRLGMGRNSVRPISESDYQLILQTGFTQLLEHEEPQIRIEDRNAGFQLSEEQAPFERPIIERVTKRLFRDAAFAEIIKSAYDKTCAMTGLKIINGGGRAEVQAAHIQPVASQGPDSVRNGIALCSTVHWMFDRGLISISNDYKILTAKDKIPEAMGRLLRPDRKLLLPKQIDFYPHVNYLNYHREQVFKG